MKETQPSRPRLLESERYVDYSVWKNWDAFFQFGTDDASYFAQEVPNLDLQGKRVLEIGFGEGRFLAWAKAKGGLVVGMERDDRSLAAAHRQGCQLSTILLTMLTRMLRAMP